MHDFIPHHLLNADRVLITGAGTGLIKTVPGREVPAHGSVAGFLHKALESGKMGQTLCSSSWDSACRSDNAGSNWDLLSRCATVVKE